MDDGGSTTDLALALSRVSAAAAARRVDKGGVTGLVLLSENTVDAGGASGYILQRNRKKRHMLTITDPHLSPFTKSVSAGPSEITMVLIVSQLELQS